MSAPIVDSHAIVPLAILAASLLGSGHCVAMCGGLTLMFARTRRTAAAYHFGRLLSYAGLGALAGALGQAALGTRVFAVLPWLTTAAIALPLLYLGVARLSGRSMHLRLPTALTRVVRALWPKRPGDSVGSSLTVGLLSAFLPCGWLYGFVLAAAVTQSAALGAVSLALFWAGTLPALASASLLLTKLLRPLGRLAPRFSGALLIVAALFTVAVRATPLVSSLERKAGAPQALDQGMGASCPFHHHE
ncbi:MAG: sulfite exporter TauE/SafE family protein [Deltaproteobacteria bacterium]|nr:sulfite exporter TauE/SafE family protein [Deltaproteobacteria bacterium]